VVKETSDSDNWSSDLRTPDCEGELVRRLNALSVLIGSTFHIRVWFVELLGRRRSYVAGMVADEPRGADVAVLPLTSTLAVASDGWQDLPLPERERLLRLLRKMIPAEA